MSPSGCDEMYSKWINDHCCDIVIYYLIQVYYNVKLPLGVLLLLTLLSFFQVKFERRGLTFWWRRNLFETVGAERKHVAIIFELAWKQEQHIQRSSSTYCEVCSFTFLQRVQKWIKVPVPWPMRQLSRLAGLDFNGPNTKLDHKDL